MMIVADELIVHDICRPFTMRGQAPSRAWRKSVSGTGVISNSRNSLFDFKTRISILLSSKFHRAQHPPEVFEAAQSRRGSVSKSLQNAAGRMSLQPNSKAKQIAEAGSKDSLAASELSGAALASVGSSRACIDSSCLHSLALVFCLHLSILQSHVSTPDHSFLKLWPLSSCVDS